MKIKTNKKSLKNKIIQQTQKKLNYLLKLTQKKSRSKE